MSKIEMLNIEELNKIAGGHIHDRNVTVYLWEVLDDKGNLADFYKNKEQALADQKLTKEQVKKLLEEMKNLKETVNPS